MLFRSGRTTMERLGLSPHVRTGSGGYHVYAKHPGWHVPTLNGKAKKILSERWPGLDVKGDGGYTIFTGSTEKGGYHGNIQGCQDCVEEDITEIYAKDSHQRHEQDRRHRRPVEIIMSVEMGEVVDSLGQKT